MPDTVGSILQNKGHHVWSVSPGESVLQAIGLMAEKGIGALVVIADEKLVGIISERDYARKVILHGKSSAETPVSQIMSSPVITVSPGQTVQDCMHLMTERRVRHLPVLEGKKVAGVVSIGDLVNWVISEQEMTIRHLEAYISGSATT